MGVSNDIAKGIIKAVLTLAALVLLLYFLWLIQSVITYLIIGLIVAMMGTPIVRFLKRRLKFPHTLAVIATLSIFMGFVFGFVALFVPLVLAQGHNLSVLNPHEIQNSALRLLDQITVFLESYGIDGTRLLKDSNISSRFNLGFLPNFLNNFLNILGNIGMGLASVLFITFFFLKDQNLFIRSIKICLPSEHRPRIIESLMKIHELLSSYFLGLVLQLTVVFALYLIVLIIFGVQNALVIAFLCALLNIIPYVGPLIGAVVAALLTMMSNIGADFSTVVLPTTIHVMIGFWIVQLIDNNLTGPLIFSNSVNSHPLEIFLVILIAGFLSGILGMILAVPLYTILKVVAKEFFPTNPLVRILTLNL